MRVRKYHIALVGGNLDLADFHETPLLGSSILSDYSRVRLMGQSDGCGGSGLEATPGGAQERWVVRQRKCRLLSRNGSMALGRCL